MPRSTHFDTNLVIRVPSVSKYLNCLREPCITPAGVAPVVDRADQQAKSMLLNYSE